MYKIILYVILNMLSESNKIIKKLVIGIEFMNKIIKNILKYRKKFLIILVIILFVIFLFIFINKNIEDKRNNIDVSNAIHGVVIEDNVGFYKKPKISKWFGHIRDVKIGENAYIVEEIKDEDGKKWSKVKIGDKVGYVLSEKVDYFEFSEDNEFALMSDVSKFNIQFEHFKTTNDYQVFLLNSNINYVYIRAGGRGYGEEGNLYKDNKFKVFIEACEYLGVPYGFYYIDEAINSEEIDEEIKFIQDFIKENSTKNNVLPLVIDVEKHDGVGRADELWEERAELISELIQKFKENGIETIVYTNANLANEFLYTVDTKFWLAYYNLENKVPNYWFDKSGQEASTNLELMDKLVGWQFTETGAGKEIPYEVDVSIVKNEFFREFVK